MKSVFLFFLLVLSNTSIACTGGTFISNLTPAGSYQTVSVVNGNYYTMNVTCGNVYNFDFCNNGGNTNGGLWAEITILNSTGTTELAFAPYSGGCTTLSWTATFTGSIRVLITDSGCFSGGTWGGTMAYNEAAGGPLDSSFTLVEVCGGATANITGTSGGTFSFNPAPGDGAQINSTTGNISNATAGNSYTVQYTICGASSTQSVTVLTDNCFNLNGNAQYISVGGEQCIQLTAEINAQTGCSWSPNTVDFSQGFSLTLDYYFGNNINGADGNTFTFQPSSSSACGQNGGQLGAGGIANALSIEFDTYDNDNPAHVYDMSCDHIAVEIDGNMLGPGAPYAGPVCAKSSGGNIDDGGTYEVVIEWDPATLTLNIYFNGALRLTTTGDFVNTVFGGQSQVYWGATSATGGLNNQQYFCPSTITILPSELASFESVCTSENSVLRWNSASEYRLKDYIAEYSTDGIVYYPFETVAAMGNSTGPVHYETSVKIPAEAQLFRLKMIDEDGAFEYSPSVARQHCITSGLIASQFSSLGSTHFTFSEPCRVEILDMTGKTLIHSEQYSNEISIHDLATGIYIVKASNLSGDLESRKVLIGSK
jgi:hypothetical protein